MYPAYLFSNHFLFCIAPELFKNVLGTGSVPEWSYGTYIIEVESGSGSGSYGTGYLPCIIEGSQVADPDPYLRIRTVPTDTVLIFNAEPGSKCLNSTIFGQIENTIKNASHYLTFSHIKNTSSCKRLTLSKMI
jgi:hypothetical protein